MEGLLSSVAVGIWLILQKLNEAVKELLPDGLSPGITFYNLQGEVLQCPPLLCFLVGLLFLGRLVQSLRSRRYVRREKLLAETLAVYVEQKCRLLDTLCDTKKAHAETESSLKKARRKTESFNIPRLAEDYRQAQKSSLMMKEELNSLVRALEEERSKCSRQEEKMGQVLKVLQSLAVLRATAQAAEALGPALGFPQE